MKYAIGLALSIAAAVFAWQLAAPVRQKWELENQQQAAIAQLDYQQRQFELQQQQLEQRASMPARVAGAYLWPLLIGAGVVGLAWLCADMYRQRRTPLVSYGAGLPVPRALVEAGDPRLLEMMARAVALEGEAAALRAIHQPG